MKPLGPRRPPPPPPPPPDEPWTTILALMLMILGIGFALFGFHDAGAISDEAALAIMALVVAVSAGIILAMDLERQAYRDAWTRWGEMPPFFDIYTVWPPATDRGTQGETGEKRQVRRRPGRHRPRFGNNFPADKH